MQKSTYPNFWGRLRQRPQAWAYISGDAAHPDITGTVRFYATVHGVLTVAEIAGLPNPKKPCGGTIFGFHIHEGASCTGIFADPFARTGSHYDPNGCPHPYHAGDLPPLFGANGYAFAVNLTDRFTVEEIVGRTVVIHSSPDDFTSQPAGNAGTKIACGEIIG